ncbi:MAG: LPS export ABC transporter periplasmic protein LptC [Pseudomonadota bacterium]
MNAASVHSEAISTWAPQRQMTLAQARKRSDMVGLLRMLFVAGAAISAGIMIGPIAASALTGATIKIDRIPGDQVVTMVNARFTGRNIAGESYIITAKTARRQRADSRVIDLTNPELIDDRGTVITAPEGVYRQSEAVLDLFGDVQVVDGQGYTFSSTAARVYIEDGRIIGLEPLEGGGPLGDVRADSYEITDDGDRVILRGNVDMIINPRSNDETEPPEGE